MPRGTNFYDHAKLQGRLWTPAALTSARLLAWFRAADLASIVIGTGVATWVDKSGRGNNVTQGTGASQPTFQPAGFNGRPTVKFNASGLTCTLGSAVPAGTKLQTFAVVRSTFATGYCRVFTTNDGAGADSASGKYIPLLRNAGNEQWSAFSGSLLNASPTFAEGDDCIVSSVVTATQHKAFLNGKNSGGSAFTYPSAYAPTQMFVGYNPGTGVNGSDQFIGLLPEIFVLTGAVSDAERQKFEGYLAWTTGLQQKLGGHPFANRPPMIGD